MLLDPGMHNHVGIVTADLDAGMASLSSLFGLTWAEVLDGAGMPPFVDGHGAAVPGLVRVVHSRGGPLRVELLQGRPGSVWETAEVARLHHLASWVDDLPTAVAAMQAQGWTLEVTLAGPAGAPSGFAYLARPGHARVELNDRAARAATLERLGWVIPD